MIHDLLSSGIFVIYAKQQPNIHVILLREKQSKRKILKREDVLGVE